MIQLLSFLLRSSRRVVALSVVAGLVGGLGGVGLIALIHAELGKERPSGATLGLAFGALCLLAAGTRVASQALMAQLGQGAVADLRVSLGRKILDLSLARFEEVDPGSVLAVLTEDVSIVAGAITGLPLVAINGPILLGGLAYAGWLSPSILVGGVGFATLAILGYLALARSGMERLREAREKGDDLLGNVRGVIEGFRELKLHRGRREALIAQGLRPSAVAVRDASSAGLARFALADGWGQLAYFGFLGFLLFVLPAIRPIDRPTLSGAVLIILYLLAPLDVMLMWLPILGRASASMKKIETLLPSLESLGHSEPAPRPLAFRDAIRLEGVTHAYPGVSGDRGFALGPIDLSIEAGETIFLAGGNGSGKTTLVKLLTGLYSPDSGVIQLDGRPVLDADRESYRQLFAAVFADGHLFPRLYGLDAPDLDARAADGLERLNLSEKVRVEGGRFSTIDLSQGQRRRLALLAATLEDRPIEVYDEWAANQDPHFKKFFYRELLAERKAIGKTLIVISHDEDYYDVADRVVRLQDGRIAGDAVVEAANACAWEGRRAEEST